MESENQVLRQQALTISPNGNSLSARPRTTIIQVVMEYCNFYGICACKSVLSVPLLTSRELPRMAMFPMERQRFYR